MHAPCPAFVDKWPELAPEPVKPKAAKPSVGE